MKNLRKSNGSLRRVLVVEDDRPAREATQRFLQIRGHDVAAAPDPDTALDAARAHAPHVLVCDCNLKEKLDGVEVARSIQKQHRSAVIFVTAHTYRELEAQLDGIDVHDCLHKPISLAALADSVEAVELTAPVSSET